MDEEFYPGQRWVNQAELQLGMGTVLTVEHRTITLLFEASGHQRTYARDSAPLNRVRFPPGDTIRNQAGKEMRVQSVEETDNGLLVYTCLDSNSSMVLMPETDIDFNIPLHGPRDRLLSGLLDEDKWYKLRYQTLVAWQHIGEFPVTSISGCRTDLIPHQLYIAHEVSRRYAPRVLLADEVGLGKTIEAGLILHAQLYAEQINRVLIVVPENLLHQWLVEMLRRFNLRFSLFDLDRYQAMLDEDGQTNPFTAEQLVLCSLDTLTANTNFYEDALAAGWDMLVVDEAHHLHWSDGVASHEYALIERLARIIPSVLLLTATPEQLGRAGHFARLRLLDPARFSDYPSFLKEEQHYEPVASLIESLLADSDQVDIKIIDELEQRLDTDLSSFVEKKDGKIQLPTDAYSSLINHLLDHHGTGRVLFRNSRAAVSGFPERHLHTYPLAAPRAYLSLDRPADIKLQKLVAPELSYMEYKGPDEPHWTRIDPRIEWLIKLLQTLAPEKVLVITASARTALDITETLRNRAGIYSAVFHEGMNILERDRAAAYFADQDQGTQLMVCSEIGSEGRNFQFAHHLVLLDLPVNPDMLEQRIGRLDRIGQKHTVDIHVPYLEQTSQEFLLSWYRDGLGAFARPCQTGLAVYEQHESAIRSALYGTHTDPAALLHECQQLNNKLLDELEKGRDRLLEYNSCRPVIATALHNEARLADQVSTLPQYMEQVFDCFGVHPEGHGDNSLIISPGEGMVTAFPHLPDEGLTITYDRETALSYEDRQFLTWTHPMVTAAMDMVSGHETGNAAVTAFRHTGFKPGVVLLECIYVIETSMLEGSGLNRILPPHLIRIIIDERGQRLEDKLSPADIEQMKRPLERGTAVRIVRLRQEMIAAGCEHCHGIAAAIAPDLINDYRHKAESIYADELARLRELARVNPNIRQAELDYFSGRLQSVRTALDSTIPRLDAVRLLVSS